METSATPYTLRPNAYTETAQSVVQSSGTDQILYTLTIAILTLSSIASGVGLFASGGGEPHEIVNQYGDVVRMYGKGLYQHDSFFRAPIFRGTDFTMFFIACPLLILSLILDVLRKTIKTRLFLVSVVACFNYYATSIAFGVTYNELHLVYILLFSASFFGLIVGMMSFPYGRLAHSTRHTLPYRGMYIFLALTGVALYIAWLPDILSAMAARRPLLLIETYTTEITYVLDMGIIAPLALICLYLLKQRKAMGYVLLDMLLTLCVLIGIMLPIQTIFQMQAGIELSLPVIVTKVAIFCVLAVFALYFKIQAMRNVVNG
ncbi:hypothetical protein GCM10023189_34850 [Nibrella saemangeumensis]|uniref:DUF998 domain-containing protein n=1 Tax=Nibrella saemangeumensis TaxID=1084526 RepID=A0ABP8N2G3_9BACT